MVPTKVIARQCRGVLLPDVALPFDDVELAGTTVADVLADPVRFEGATLADPFEGIEYGACKAQDHAPGGRHAVDTLLCSRSHHL